MLADTLGYVYLDSGGIYRAFTYAVIQRIGYCESPEEFRKQFLSKSPDPSELPVSVKVEDNKQVLYYENENITAKIREPGLTRRIAPIADDVRFRNKVNSILREIAGENNVVVDGRDMGTVVFPESRFKFYLDATIEIRAKRRWQEYRELAGEKTGHSLPDLETIKKEIEKRDLEDRNRISGKLQIPVDAIVIDTSYLSRNMVVNIILCFLQKVF